MSEQLALLPGYLTAHLQLALVALLLGTTIGVPLGVAVSRRRRWRTGVLGAASVAQTIPGLALLALMVPLLAWLGRTVGSRLGLEVPAIGFLPAVLALALYSLLPILRNTVTGLAGVDPAVVEAARAVGMTRRQRLLQVELPMALPVVAAGLRIATVWVVGTATLSTPVGAPSLGNYIFSGLQTRNSAAVIVGCVAAAFLALALDLLVRAVELGLSRRDRRLTWAAAATMIALLAYALITLLAGARAERRTRPVVIGAKTFTEQYILAEILADRVRRAGHPARVAASLGSTVAFDALVAGEIDAYVDYTGTLWATVLGRDSGGETRDEVMAAVAAELEVAHGVELAAALGFENAYALAMRRDRAEELGIRTIADLAAHAPKLELAADYEFLSRAEWRSLERAYDLAFGSARSLDPSLMYEAVANGSVDAISAFSSDGRIAAFDLVVLADPAAALPPYDAVVLIGAPLARERPRAVAALVGLEGAIDADAMRRMNRLVDAEGRSPAKVAAGFSGLD